ncbi:zona pellucida-binding protein 2-like [Nycticebus coucang]|uniref:zona pellucida-binding protein 2-like n=1 Tax=Nycticebus coucang TaxID=9470 RepID=UPI00234D3FFC|nr:zona pellucida-binding protein 2-like [Nycticebus coucang]
MTLLDTRMMSNQSPQPTSQLPSSPLDSGTRSRKCLGGSLNFQCNGTTIVSPSGSLPPFGAKISQLSFRVLKKILDNLMSDLSCHVIEPSYKCHSVEIPERGLIYELFIAFQVNPFAPGWRSLCNKSDDCEDITNHNVLQARNRIEEFFRSQTYIFYHHVNKTVPAMHFVDHSFQVERLDSCRPGFGKNEGLHSNCATCCVVCSPGTFSPDIDVICQLCISIHIYGAKSCP